jgi:hypothetical protein
MTSYPQTLAVKKLTKMGFFSRYITFRLRMTQILHIPKIVFVVCRTLTLYIIISYNIFVQTDLERQWTDIKEKVMEEIFRLCRSLLLSKNFDSTKYVLDQWFSFCEGDVTKGLRKFYGY